MAEGNKRRCRGEKKILDGKKGMAVKGRRGRGLEKQQRCMLEAFFLIFLHVSEVGCLGCGCCFYAPVLSMVNGSVVNLETQCLPGKINK